MTFVSGSKLFYLSKNLSFENLCTILRHRASLRSVDAVPTIYFDTSWLGRKLSTSSSSSVCSIVELCKLFSNNGISVVLAMDNRSYRHHSKKSTLIRDRKVEQARIDSIIICSNLMRKIHQLRDPTLTLAVEEEIHDKMNVLEKAVKKNEKIILDRLRYKNFFEEIHDAINSCKAVENFNITIVEAVTQADSVICYQCNKGDCDGALSSDGDFIVNSGKKILLIRDFKFFRRGKKNVNKIGSFEIASSHYSVMEDCLINCLCFTDDSITKPLDSYNLLENDDVLLRATIAIGTGCDALPFGIKNVGISFVRKQIVENNVSSKSLLEIYSGKSTINKSVLESYVESILFEPGDTVLDYKVKKRKYMNHKPKSLSNYCKEFGKSIKKGYQHKLVSCIGSIDNGHMFMEQEGIHICSRSTSTLCMYCCADTSNDFLDNKITNEILCMK